MDIEDLRSDLQALSKLYGLLKSDRYRLQNENSENLDHKARFLLRNLLDSAAEQTFKAHSEILAARHGSNDITCSNKQEPSKEMLNLQLPPFLTTNISNNFASVIQSTNKDLNTQKAVLEKNEWESSKPERQLVSSEQPGLKIFSSQPQVRKRCRVCQRSKAKQLKSSDEPKAVWGIPSQLQNLPFQFGQSNLLEKELITSKKALQTDSLTESQRKIGSSEFKSNQTEIGYSACSPDRPAARISAEVLKKPEVADQISKEASFKIQEIESRISDLQITSRPRNPPQIQYGAQYELHEPMVSSDPGTESANSMLQTKRRLVTRNNISQIDFFAGRNDLKSRLISQKVWGPTQWHQVPNQVIARTLEPLPPIGAMPIQTESQNAGKIKGLTFEYDRLSEVRKPIEEYKLPRQNENQVPGKNVRVIIDRIESVSEARSRDDHMESQNSKFGQHQTGLKKSTGFGNVWISQPSTPSVRSRFSRLQAVDTGSELSRARTKRETRMPDQKITRKNLLHHKPTQHRVAPRLYGDDRWEKDQGGVRMKNDHFVPQRLISPSEEVSESTGSRSVYSSSWTSQQVSTSFSDDEGYSLSSQIQSHHFSSGYSTSNVGPNMSRSRSESEIYSISSRSRDYPFDSDISGESQDDYLSSDETPVHQQSLGSTSRRKSVDPTKSRRLEKKQEPGRLKKLKDKLAIIFHHHHHHHHHHDSGPHVVVKGGGKALWKNAGKILDRRKEADDYGEKAVKKVRKSGGHNVPDKNQRGHFHALVEGLLQHIRHSKKSKPPKGGVGGGSGGRSGSGGKKVAARLHWWQMLSRQRGSKMPKKPHGKVRVGRRNPRLKALPEP